MARLNPATAMVRATTAICAKLVVNVGNICRNYVSDFSIMIICDDILLKEDVGELWCIYINRGEGENDRGSTNHEGI